MHTPHPWRGIRAWKRHSLVLLVAGAVYICVGFSYIFGDSARSTLKSLYYPVHWGGLPVYGFVFVLAGCLSIISSRWPPVSEKWGYAVMTGLSSGWAGMYLVGILFKHPPTAASLRGLVSWGLLGFLWWAISGLVNPPSKEEPSWTSHPTQQGSRR